MLSGHVKRLREKSAILDDLKASLNDIVKKVEENFDEDPTNYKNAKWAFTKTVKSFLGKKIEPYIQPIKHLIRRKKYSRGKNRTIHSAFHTFDMETVLTKKARKA